MMSTARRNTFQKGLTETNVLETNDIENEALTSKCRPAHTRVSPHICDISLQLVNVNRGPPYSVGGNSRGGLISSAPAQTLSALANAYTNFGGAMEKRRVSHFARPRGSRSRLLMLIQRRGEATKTAPPARFCSPIGTWLFSCTARSVRSCCPSLVDERGTP